MINTNKPSIEATTPTTTHLRRGHSRRTVSDAPPVAAAAALRAARFVASRRSCAKTVSEEGGVLLGISAASPTPEPRWTPPLPLLAAGDALHVSFGSQLAAGVATVLVDLTAIPVPGDVP